MLLWHNLAQYLLPLDRMRWQRGCQTDWRRCRCGSHTNYSIPVLNAIYRLNHLCSMYRVNSHGQNGTARRVSLLLQLISYGSEIPHPKLSVNIIRHYVYHSQSLVAYATVDSLYPDSTVVESIDFHHSVAGGFSPTVKNGAHMPRDITPNYLPLYGQHYGGEWGWPGRLGTSYVGQNSLSCTTKSQVTNYHGN